MLTLKLLTASITYFLLLIHLKKVRSYWHLNLSWGNHLLTQIIRIHGRSWSLNLKKKKSHYHWLFSSNRNHSVVIQGFQQPENVVRFTFRRRIEINFPPISVFQFQHFVFVFFPNSFLRSGLKNVFRQVNLIYSKKNIIINSYKQLSRRGWKQMGTKIKIVPTQTTSKFCSSSSSNSSWNFFCFNTDQRYYKCCRGLKDLLPPSLLFFFVNTIIIIIIIIILFHYEANNDFTANREPLFPWWIVKRQDKIKTKNERIKREIKQNQKQK